MRPSPASGALAALRTHQVAFEHMNQGIVMVDAAGTIPIANGKASQMLGMSVEKMKSTPAYREVLEIQWNSGEFGPGGAAIEQRVREMIRAATDKSDLYGGVDQYERVRPNGTIIEVRTTALPEGGIVRTYTDITERKRAEALIAHIARHDPLTGLANRRFFRDRLDGSLADLRSGGEPFALFYIDLDQFKPINDAYGHATGDAVLEAVGSRIRGIVDQTDMVARLGGDEFAVIKTGVRNRIEAGVFAEQIVEQVSKVIHLDEHELAVSASVGVALAPSDASSTDGLQTKADIAMYQAKQAGRNAYRCFTSGELLHDADRSSRMAR